MGLSEPEQNLVNLPKLSESEISDGVGGNVQTIDFMKRVARIRANDPLIRKLALNILAQYGIKSHHFLDEALAIGDYVRRKVRYVRDPDNVEYLQDPLDLVKQIQSNTAQGDCDDMATLIAALLLSIGAQPVFRAVRYDSGFGNYNHIYVVVYESNPQTGKQRVVLDGILKNVPMGTEIQHASGDEYPV